MTMRLNFNRFLVLIVMMVVLAGSAFAQSGEIIIQSTTSTQNSGLLDYILPEFTKQTGIKVYVVAVGTGQALKNGQNGDGDVILVHAKEAEEMFVSMGFGADRRDVMYNDFVLIGPKDDPAGVASTDGITGALRSIAGSQSRFVSRGDDSGTHKKEMNLWKASDLATETISKADWYRESGSGMGATLNIAAGMNAYTLTDRATWISFENKSDLKILSQGDPLLFNQYGIMLVNPERHPHIKADKGTQLIDWLTSGEGQALIASYKLGGKQLFFPNAN